MWKMEKITLAQATELLLQEVSKITEMEKVSLWDADGRVLARDIYAEKNQPPFSRSPLDGYAVRSADIAEASREHAVNLKVIDEITAGHASQKQVTEGTAIRIMTGAPIPEGADCVIKQEHTDYGEQNVAIYNSVKAYQNYCFAGEDYHVGDKLLEKGMILHAIEIGVLASLGYEQVEVYRKPKVALFSTGDELVLPGQELSEGKIYDSNLYALGIKMQTWDVQLVTREQVGDEPETLAKKLDEICEQVDLIVTTGGVSVGKKDILHDTLKILGAERIFWKMKIKPGMPTLCAKYRGKLFICLSGNPYGASVNLELLVKPVLEKMTGRRELQLKRKTAVMQDRFEKASPVTRYVRATYEDGKVWISKGSNDSGILSSMCGCNCLIEIVAGTLEVCEGDTVCVVML